LDNFHSIPFADFDRNQVLLVYIEFVFVQFYFMISFRICQHVNLSTNYTFMSLFYRVRETLPTTKNKLIHEADLEPLYFILTAAIK